MEELGKALKEYSLNTGEVLPADGTYGYLTLTELIISTKPGSHAPYINIPLQNTAAFEDSEGKVYGIYRRTSNNWAAGTLGEVCTTSNRPCNNYVSIMKRYTLAEIEEFSEYVDGEKSIVSGRVRAYKNTNGLYNLYLDVGLAFNQP